MYNSLQSVVKLYFYPILFELFDRMGPYTVCVCVRTDPGHRFRKQQMCSTVRQGISVDSKNLKHGHFVNRPILNRTQKDSILSSPKHMRSLSCVRIKFCVFTLLHFVIFLFSA